MSTDQRYFTVKTAIQYGKVKQFQLVLIITSISVMIHLVVICCHGKLRCFLFFCKLHKSNFHVIVISTVLGRN